MPQPIVNSLAGSLLPFQKYWSATASKPRFLAVLSPT
jgi:hypothetical protein